jgi:PKD repeat protein
VSLLILLQLSTTIPIACGAESAPITRRGHFEEITDCATGQYVIESFRMCADGSRAVFYVRQTIEDGRGCLAYQLRVIDTDGANETVVEQGFTYDTGVGNYCANGLYDAYDISDDGGMIAYLRLRDPAELAPEIMVYDVAGASKTSVLQTLPHRAYGETHQVNIDPYAGRPTFVMTGDGTQVFFINGFGPYGSPGSTGEPGPSGFTVYRVFTDGLTVPAAVYTSADLATTPGVSVSAMYVVASGGWLAVDRTGSLLLVPVGGSFPSANPPKHTLKMNPGTGAASAEVFLDFIGLGLSGPALSSDGLTAVFARSGSAEPGLNGLFARGIHAGDPEVLLDAKLRWATNPAVSGDGTAVVHNVDQGGGSSPALLYAAADGSILLPLTEPIVFTRFDYGAISENGARVVFCGAVKGATIFEPLTNFNLVRMDWDSDAEPRIDGIAAEPELTVLRTTIFDYEPPLNTHYYTVSGTALAGMYTYPFNNDASVPGGTSRFHVNGGILDNGIFGGDAVAGDGIFTEDGLFITSEAVEAPLKLRAGVTTRAGRASFVDAVVPLRNKVLAAAHFSASPVIGPAPLEVTFQDLSTGDYLETRWDFQGNYSIDHTGNRGETVPFTYTNAGNYTPWLIATGRGSTHEVRNVVTIRVFASHADLARTLSNEMDPADVDASGSLDFAEAVSVVPGLDQALFESWDTNQDEVLGRRELLTGAGGSETVHTGDQDGDLRIQLSELLRLIQFYNSGVFHCAETPGVTEDGYAPGPGDQSCAPHFSDYEPQDWAVQLSELLRIIQFYNLKGYTPCPGTGTEDGFCPGP